MATLNDQSAPAPNPSPAPALTPVPDPAPAPVPSSAPTPTTARIASFRETFELLSKGWVFVIAAVYGSGYLIISIYHASLGVDEISPLRPKVAAAGLLFVALGSGAVYLAYWVRSYFRSANNYQSDAQRLQMMLFTGGLGLYCCDLAGANALDLMMHYDTAEPRAISFWMLQIFGFALYAVVLAGGRSISLQRWTTHWAFLALCALLTVALVLLSYPRHNEFGSRQFAFFLGTVQFAVMIGSAPNPKSKWLQFNSWYVIVGPTLTPFFIFGLWVYPHTRAAFGGGQPAQAEMWIVPTDNNTKNPTSVTVKIVDETDSGFYVIQPNDERVRYVPRGSVASVIFERPKGLGFYATN